MGDEAGKIDSGPAYEGRHVDELNNGRQVCLGFFFLQFY